MVKFNTPNVRFILEKGISVIVPTKGRGNKILKCIDSILNQTLLPNEIIIVDSSKNVNLDAVLKRKFPLVHPKIVYIHSGVCLAAARNLGVQHSSGDIVFFFDDDVVLDKNYMKEVVKIFLNDKERKIGGVMGNITNIRRDASSLGAMLNRLFFLSHFGNGKNTFSGLPTFVHGEGKVIRTDFLSGCMMAYRREVLREFVFDEKLGKIGGYCYLEDVDFSYRVSRKYTLLYTPFAKLEHHPSWLRMIGDNQMMKNRQFIFNHFYLFKKNSPKHLLNVFAFYVSVFGYLIVTLLFSRNPKAVIGWFQGIRDIASNEK